MFGDRDTWFNHELKHHHSLYVCKLCGLQHPTTKLLQRHIIDEHGPYSNEEIQSLIEHGRLVPSQLKAQSCPFCDDWASILSHRRHGTDGQASSSTEQADILVSLTHFKRHVATHQEQLAIFAVPRMVEDEEERSPDAGDTNSEAFSSKDGNSQTTDKATHSIEKTTGYELSPTCVYLSGLPPHVRQADIARHFGLKEPSLIAKIKLLDGFGFIDFDDPNDAKRAVTDFDGHTLMGMPVKVQFARSARDPETGRMRLIEGPYSDNLDPAQTTENPATVSRVIFSQDQDVAFKPKPPTPDYAAEWYLGRVTRVVGEGKSLRYNVRDEDPDVPPPDRKEYRMSAKAMIPISPPSAELPQLPKGKTVLALYPDTTTFYRAEVIGLDAITGNVGLRFEGEEQSGTQQFVERRFVMDYRD
jgi:RNA recognition motif-containing protein